MIRVRLVCCVWFIYLIMIGNIVSQIKPQIDFWSQSINSYQESQSIAIKDRKSEILHLIKAIQNEDTNEEHAIPVVFYIPETDAENVAKKIVNLIDNVNSLINTIHIEKFDKNIDSVTLYSKLAAPLDINFCLAKLNENQGKAIQSIKYSRTILTSYQQDFLSEEFGGISPKITENVINVYVLQIEGNIAGYASQPWIDSDKKILVFNLRLLEKIDSNKDVVVQFAHLLGTFLGLNELWTADGLCKDDDVDDTPIHNAPNTEVYKSHHHSTCNGFPYAMTMNIMDNSQDAFMFTIGQKKRIHAFLGVTGPLSGLSNNEFSCPKPRPLNRNKNSLTSFNVFPNPTQDVLNIEWNQKSMVSDIELNMYDMQGVKVVEKIINIEKDIYKYRLDVQSLSAGAYLLSLKTKDFTTTKKVFITR